MRVYDRNGKEYEMNEMDAKAALNSGAYFSTSTPSPTTTYAVYAPPKKSKKVDVIDRASGRRFSLLAINAREAIRTGKYVYADEAPKQDPAGQGKADAPTDEQKPVLEDSKAVYGENSDAGQAEEYPRLSKANSKKEIQAALAKYGVQFRANLGEAQLLELWENFLAEKKAE